jgi:multicomponent Na+:H+ antiporter subunit B
MNSIILQTAARLLFPLILLFSGFLLLRGHNDPGGGFSGGLVAAGGFTLYAIAFTPAEALRILRARPEFLGGLGVLIAAAVGTVGLFRGEAFLKANWWVTSELAPTFKIAVGTPLVFDCGVYLAVLGGALLVILSLMEEVR